ncbi:LysR family transcriptional regulator [Uliginosibacterium sp. TH139]|uniref:LysR family transcriptional regulator n=1 Tax=Uliginosibacterium sp. TH139 TaxID=2067453 RepID=UPI000C7D7296|nr:LysR family transcriptional regulator [Uliginosibacterium sp. TH139]PLK48456.1 LysR family transcriptional regulator [Uliginosibacterium sp. TH139]
MLNRLEMLRIFVAAAEATSFKEAAVRMGISPQVVTRAVKELEESLGELLFHRSTRQVRITAFGEAFVARAREGVQQVDQLFPQRGEAAEGEIAGRVRIAAPLALGRLRLMPALAQLSAEHPGLSFDLRLSDQIADVVDEQIDVGVRIGFRRDNRFIARPVSQLSFHVVATPALIARVGRPQRIEDLHALPTSAMLDKGSGRPWPWLFAGGQQFHPERTAFICDDAETEAQAVLAGMAFGQVPGLLAEPHVAAGRLEEVLLEVAPEPWNIYVYRPQRGPVPARIRRVFDVLVTALSAPGEPAGPAEERVRQPL